MKIQLEFAAVLKVQGARSGEPFELADDATVADLLNGLHVAPEHHKYVAPFINGQKAKLSSRLRPGDKCFLSLPVGGG